MNWRIFTLLMTGWVVTGCGRSAGPPSAKADRAMASQSSAPAAATDPCTLLDPKEVEAVLGPLAGPPFRTRLNEATPAEEGESCRYESTDLHSIALEADWTGGTMTLKMMSLPGKLAGAAKMKGSMPKGLLPEDVSIAGEWDEVRVIGCCNLNAFLGDAMVGVDFSGSRASAEQAVGLVNKALLRLDKRIAVDGSAGLAAAQQRMAARPKKRKVCELVTRAEAEAIGGPLAEEPTGDNAECQYRYAVKPGARTNDVVVLKVRWIQGFGTFREDITMSQSVGASLGVAFKGIDTSPPGPWDQASVVMNSFYAVKKDVLVTVEAGLRPDMSAKIATKAIEKL